MGSFAMFDNERRKPKENWGHVAMIFAEPKTVIVSHLDVQHIFTNETSETDAGFSAAKTNGLRNFRMLR